MQLLTLCAAHVARCRVVSCRARWQAKRQWWRYAIRRVMNEVRDAVAEARKHAWIERAVLPKYLPLYIRRLESSRLLSLPELTLVRVWLSTACIAAVAWWVVFVISRASASLCWRRVCAGGGRHSLPHRELRCAHHRRHHVDPLTLRSATARSAEVAARRRCHAASQVGA
jgi:hypothetical protein